MSKAQKRLAADKTIYGQITDYLIDEIKSGRLPVGSSIPSEGVLAKQFGVSRGTTKLALAKLAEMGMAKRVARLGTFVEACAPQFSPVKGDRQRVVLMIPCLPDSYLRTIVEGVERVARTSGVDVILRITDHSEEVERLILREIGMQEGIGGLIIYPVNGHLCCDELLQLKLKGYPIVVVDREYRGIGVDSVVPDHFGGAKIAVKHLVDLGHRAIGFASIDINRCSASEMRYWGYVEAMAEAGLTLKPSFVLKDGQLAMDIPGITDELVRSLAEHLERNRDMSALFCSNDYIAVAAVEAAGRLGLEIPDALSVVGFSNNEISRISPVTITTIEHCQAITGEKAMELMLERIHQPTLPCKRICLEAALIFGNSSGCFNGHHT